MAGEASLHKSPSDGDHQQMVEELLHDQTWALRTGSSFLDKLPAEILHQILSYLPARDLVRVSAACRTLAEHGSDDLLWADLVNSHLPSRISDPGPFDSFRRLYLAHLSYWFIPQYKLWFSDTNHTGNLILARYDNRRGVIDAYRIIADRGETQFQIWNYNPEVMISSFDPTVSLWLDDPVLLLKDPNHSSSVAACQAWMAERRMPMVSEAQHLFNSVLLCPNVRPQNRFMTAQKVWPPPIIPSDRRVSRDIYPLPLPQCESDVSQRGFRIRRWAHFRFGLSAGPSSDNEAVFTYATLEPSLYTPTKEKPYQGIWVGDYSAHGCEFLLVFQRDLPRSDSVENDEQVDDADGDVIQKGSLEAVKLTGDPNVPRGEITFMAADIGPQGLVRVAEEDPFKGARIVRSQGHVAGLGFHDDTFTNSQLILVSTDYIAHYWEEMGHISYYRRVDIDALLQT